MIKIKDFIKGRFHKRVHTVRERHPVYRFLIANKSMAFKIEEISRQIDMNESTIRSMMRHLVNAGLIWHKAPYYAWRK